MRELTPELIEEKNKLDSIQPFLLLIEIWLTADGLERFCFLYHDEQVEFDGLTYVPFPVVVGEISENSEGDLPQWPITIGGIGQELAGDLEQHGGFFGKRVRMLLVHKDHLDDPDAFLEDAAFVQTCYVDGENIHFTVGHTNLSDLKVAARRLNTRCDFRYRDPETCAYAGALPTCDHSLSGANGCIAHGVDSVLHPKRFGGEPSIPKGG